MIYKILRPAFIVITGLLVLAFPSLASAATLSLQPLNGTFNRGCILGVDIMLDTENKQTEGTDVILIYDPSKLAVTTSDITSGKIYQEYLGLSVDAQAGKLSISGITSAAQSYSGKGLFATVLLKVLDNAPTGATQIKFDFDPSDKTNSKDTNVVESTTIAELLSSVTDGNYVIGTGSCTAPAGGTAIKSQGAVGTPSATPLPTKVPVKELPQGGIFDNTILVAILGTLLTILGIAGLALL